MPIVVGIDEAGYGPVLGPLVVSQAIFRVPEELVDGCLWETLQRSISSHHHKRDHRLAIVDSKKLHHSSEGLEAIEKSALAMLAGGEFFPQSCQELLRLVDPSSLTLIREYPWYREFDEPLPLECATDLVAVQGNAVACDLKNQGIVFLGVRSQVLPEGHFNRWVMKTRNKASVLWSLTLRLMGELVQQFRNERIIFFVDRQGGRTHYATALLTAFEEGELTIAEESPERCCYRLSRSEKKGDEVEFRFLQSGESLQMPVALASIYSKYVRELLMEGLNRYWQKRVTPLVRTAGYYEDGMRFLKDIGPAIERLAIDRSQLIRSR